MSDGTVDRTGVGAGEERPAFFGAEEQSPRDEIDPGVWALIDDYLAEHAGGRERLIPLLHRVQETLGYLPFAVQEYIAGGLGLSAVEVYGVVSFYHFFTTTPRGKNELKVCMGTACFVRKAQRLLETLKQVLDIEVGEVTGDRLFSVEQVRCIGACGLAPAMMHNADTLGKLTPKELRELIVRLRAETSCCGGECSEGASE